MITFTPQINTCKSVSFGAVSKKEIAIANRLAKNFKDTGKYPDLEKAFNKPNGEHKNELIDLVNNAIRKAFGKEPEPERQGIKDLKEINKIRKSV